MQIGQYATAKSKFTCCRLSENVHSRQLAKNCPKTFQTFVKAGPSFETISSNHCFQTFPFLCRQLAPFSRAELSRPPKIFFSQVTETNQAAGKLHEVENFRFLVSLSVGNSYFGFEKSLDRTMMGFWVPKQSLIFSRQKLMIEKRPEIAPRLITYGYFSGNTFLAEFRLGLVDFLTIGLKDPRSRTRTKLYLPIIVT